MDAHLPVCANRMDDTDRQLQNDHKNPLAGHGNAPVYLVVVNDEQPDVLIMESYDEDQETPSGQADGTVDEQGSV